MICSPELNFLNKLDHVDFSLKNNRIDAVTREDINSNRKRHSEKIDNVDALIYACIAYRRNLEAFE